MMAYINRNRQTLLIAGGIIIGVLVFLLLPEQLVISSIRLATPYILGSLAALIASRAGVLNLAIEGMMLLGAFVAVAVLYKTGLNPVFGVIGAMISGGGLGFIFAVLYLRIRINLVILALALNLFVSNATVFFLRVSFGAFGTLADPSINSLPIIHLPIIDQIPELNRLSGYNILVYTSWVLVFLVWLMLFRTRFGRHIRAVGENKQAAETAGINVTMVQIFALTISGALAGVAGSFLSIGVLSQFLTDMTAGRGWTAITVSLFAFEQPVGAFLTSLFFGLSESLSNYFQTQVKIDLPPDFLLAIPQVAALSALILVAVRIRTAELLKRRNFVAQFGHELDNLRKGVFVGGQE
jgi:simple sugar transport system permease protein